MGAPDLVPSIVGSLFYYKDPKIRYPLFSETLNSESPTLIDTQTKPED